MRPRRAEQSAGFTLVEVAVALAIAGIGLLALLNLQLASIKVTEQTGLRTRALLLAQEKLAEATSGDLPEIGMTEGETKEGARLRWRVEVAEAEVDALRQANAPLPRAVTVTITWREGRAGRSLELTTFVAENE